MERRIEKSPDEKEVMRENRKAPDLRRPLFYDTTSRAEEDFASTLNSTVIPGHAKHEPGIIKGPLPRAP
jgi:hypothetical protein